MRDGSGDIPLVDRKRLTFESERGRSSRSEADLKVVTILARRPVPQWHLRVLTHVWCMTTTPDPSDPTEVAEVDPLAEFRQCDGVLQGRFPSSVRPLLGAKGYERGGEVAGGVVGFIGFLQFLA